MGNGNQPLMGFWRRWRKPGAPRGLFLAPRPLHPYRKLNGALLRFLSSPHRSGAHKPLWKRPSSGLKPEVSSKTRTSRACFWSGWIRRPHTRGERKGARHPGKHAVFSKLVPRSDPCLTRGTTFRTGAGPAVRHTWRGRSAEAPA